MMVDHQEFSGQLQELIDKFTIHYVINMRIKETNVWTIYHKHCMNSHLKLIVAMYAI